MKKERAAERREAERNASRLKLLSNEQPLFEVRAIFEPRGIPDKYYETKLIPEYLPESMGGRSTFEDLNPTVHLELEVEEVEQEGSEVLFGDDDQEDQGSNMGMVTATFVNGLDRLWLAVTPNGDEVTQAIRRCFADGMDCLRGFARRSRNPDLDRYEAVLEDWDDRVCDEWERPDQPYLNCEDWLRGDPLYESRDTVVKELIEVAFRRVDDVL